MKKLVYYILLSISALSFSACTDYINVDKYFYDQVSLDSAFSKRIYVDGWLSSAYSVMNKLGEYKEPFRWASDDLYHPDMKEYVEGSYSADKPKGDENAGESRLWKYYEGIRKASTFLDNVDRCPELTMDEIADMKGQARFLRAYCYWALIRVFGPVPLIPLEGLDADLSYEELSLPRTHFDEIVSFIDTELAETARLLPMRRTVNNLGRPTRGEDLGLRARVLLYASSHLYNGNLDFFNVVDNKGNQLISQTYDESKWAKAAAAAKDVIELAKTSGLYELYTIAPKIGTLDMYRPPVHPEYSTKDYPDGWANIDPLLSYKSNFDGSVQGSKNPELIFTRTSDGTGTINDWMYQALPRTISGNNRLCVTQKQVNAYAMNDGRTISEAANTGDYVTTGFTTEAYSENNPFLPAKVSLMYNKREPRFYASIAYNGSVWEAASASEPRYRNQQIFYYRGTEDGKQGFKEECPLTGMTLKKFYNSEDSRTDGGYVIEKTEMTIRYAEILLIYAEALNELSEGEVYHLKTYSNEDVEIKRDEDEMRYAIKRIRMRAGVPDYTNETYKNQADFRVKLKRERQVELLGENSMRYFDLRRWKDALTEENQLLQGCNINISDDDTYIADFYKETPVSSVHKVFEQRMYLFPFPTYELKRNVNLTQNPGW